VTGFISIHTNGKYGWLAQTVAEWIPLARAEYGIETEGEAKISVQPGKLSELLISNSDKSERHGQACPTVPSN